MKRKETPRDDIRRRGKRSYSTILAFVALMAVVVTAQAQVGAASLGGLVQDPTDAVIPHASVRLTNVETNAVLATTGDGAGEFNFAAVQPGTYNLYVSHAGFTAYTLLGIHLNADVRISLSDIHLKIGPATETVSVQSSVAEIPLDNGELSATITSNDIARLSIVGRDVTELQRILPGFAIRSTSATNEAPDFSQVQVGQETPYAGNGSPIAGITYKLDGADLTDPGNFGANLQNIDDSFVSQIQVETSNFGADQSSGPIVIQAVTKAGTTKYHGSLYTYARTYQLNSNDWLANYDHIPRAPDRYVYPGATFSGPIPGTHGKLTFFAGAEYDAQRNIYAYGNVGEAIINALVPTASMRQGDFSAGSLSQYLGSDYTNSAYTNLSFQPTFGIDGTPLTNGNISAYLDPGATAIVNHLLPLPNEPNTNGYNYTTENLVNNNVAQIAGRVDYAINKFNTVFARYSFEKQSQGQPQIPYYSPNLSEPDMGDVNTPGGGFVNSVHVHSAAANWMSMISPTFTNELYGTGMYFDEAFNAVTPSALTSSSIGYPYQGIYNNLTKDWPQLQDYGFDGLPILIPPDMTFGAPFLHKLIFNIGDNVTKVWGKHTVEGGVFLQRDVNNQTITNGETNGAIFDYYYPSAGTTFYTYSGNCGGGPCFDPTPYTESGNSLANFMEGIVQQFEQQNILPRTNLYFWNFAAYGQDSWRVNSSMMVTFGLRIEHLGPWLDAHHLGAAVWEPSDYASDLSTGSIFPGFRWHAIDSAIPNSGSPAPPTFYEPRVGFAWDVFRTGKTILRGGYGSYRMHDSVDDVTTAFENSEGLRTAAEYGFGSATLAGVNSLKESPTSFGGTDLTAFGLSTSDNEEPVVNNYSASVAQMLPNKSIVQISYAGNKSNFLMNNGSTSTIILNNVNAIPVGTLYLPSTAAAENAATPGTCDPGGCTPAQVAGLQATPSTPGGASVQLVRPYNYYSTIIVPRHDTYANYNALQLVWNKQAGRLNYGFNYTWSKALGILGSAADFNFTSAIDPFNIRANYGPMNFDRSQVFNAAYSYQAGKFFHNKLAGAFGNNWLISGITSIESGPNMQTGLGASPDFNLLGNVGPAGATLPVNNQTILGTPDVSLQPVLTCNPATHLAAHQYFNGACLSLPAIGQNGQDIFPYAHGPAYLDSDLTIEKSFGLGGTRSFHLRIAGFNFLNHPVNSFGTGYAQQLNLNLSDVGTGGTFAGAAYSPSSGFGFAPQKVGRRLMEVSAVYSF